MPQVIALLFLAAFLVYAWREPSTTPPGGNVETPINVSTQGQDKAGPLGATLFRDYDDPRGRKTLKYE